MKDYNISMPKSLISIRDFSKEEFLHILDVAREFEKKREQNFLAGKVIASVFRTIDKNKIII